jgi:hypothetical protein
MGRWGGTQIEKHIQVLGILYIVSGVLGLLIGGFLFIAVAGGGLISGDSQAIAITSLVAIVLTSIIFVFSIPEIIGGYWLLKRKSWARIMVLVLGFLNLLDIPIGTALGIYTIWVLMKDESAKYFT